MPGRDPTPTPSTHRDHSSDSGRSNDSQYRSGDAITQFLRDKLSIRRDRTLVIDATALSEYTGDHIAAWRGLSEYVQLTMDQSAREAETRPAVSGSTVVNPSAKAKLIARTYLWGVLTRGSVLEDESNGTSLEHFEPGQGTEMCVGIGEGHTLSIVGLDDMTRTRLLRASQ